MIPIYTGRELLPDKIRRLCFQVECFQQSLSNLKSAYVYSYSSPSLDVLAVV